jgi:Ca-activated chloride channel homolog
MFLANRWLLVFLLPAWALLSAGWILWQHHRRRTPRSSALAFPDLGLFADMPPSRTPRLRQLVQGSRLLVLLLLAFALARPEQPRGHQPLLSEGIDIVLALDTSGSMSALDLDSDRPIVERRTRLQVVQDVVKEFVKGRPNDELGMVVFGAEAFVQCPLTLDHAILGTLLDRLSIGMAGDRTAIGSGLAAAVNRLKKAKTKSKVIVLLTDGVNNTGQLAPAKAAEIAKAYGIRIYTIGAGTRGKAPFIVDTPFFGKQVAYDNVPIDEEALKEVASVTGGAYFRAEDSVALADVYKRIDALERSELDAPKPVDVEERANLFVLPALALLLAEVLLLNTRLRKLP